MRKFKSSYHEAATLTVEKPRHFLAFLFILLCILGSTSNGAAQKTAKFTLLGHWDNDSLPSQGGQTFNSCWGWTSPTGREYAIMGSIDSVYFFDVTDGIPKLCDVQACRKSVCTNREFKTYQHYCYAVADACSGASLQIFDMSYLPDSVHKVYDEDTLVYRTHNLWVEHDRLYMASYTHLKRIMNVPHIDIYPLSILSLQDPENPKLIANIEPPLSDNGYLYATVHDLYVRGDTGYCSNGGDGLFIYDFKNPKNPKLLQSITPPYPDNGYNHSNALTADGNYLVFADETHGTNLKIYDISEIKNPGNKNPDLNYLQKFGIDADQGSIPHNPFIKGDLVYCSYYHDGLVVFDISDKERPKYMGAYDTYPQNDSISDHEKKFSGFAGCWNIYVYFPSGNIIASDMSSGLFVLKMDTLTAISPEKEQLYADEVSLLGNPFAKDVSLSLNTPRAGEAVFSLHDISGRKIWTEKSMLAAGQNQLHFSFPSGLQAGVYLLNISRRNGSRTLKLVKE